jgi:hypothetical protein
MKRALVLRGIAAAEYDEAIAGHEASRDPDQLKYRK